MKKTLSNFKRNSALTVARQFHWKLIKKLVCRLISAKKRNDWYLMVSCYISLTLYLTEVYNQVSTCFFYWPIAPCALQHFKQLFNVS